jgi:hypothetical protein
MPSHRELYGDEPGPGCDFVTPRDFLEGSFYTEKGRDDSLDMKISHVVTCDYCQDKIFKFLTDNNTDPSSFDFTK